MQTLKLGPPCEREDVILVFPSLAISRKYKKYKEKLLYSNCGLGAEVGEAP